MAETPRAGRRGLGPSAPGMKAALGYPIHILKKTCGWPDDGFGKAAEWALGRPLLAFGPFLILGIVLASYGGPTKNQAFGWVAVLLAAGLAYGFWPRLKPTVLFLLAASLLTGWAGLNRALTPPAEAGHILRLIEPHSGQSYPGLMIGGTLREPVSRTPGGYQLLVAAKEAFWLDDEGPWGRRPATGLIKVNLPGPLSPDLWPGQSIRFPARLRILSGFKNPGGFDYQKYWAGRRVWAGAWLKSPALITGLDDGRRSGWIARHRLAAAGLMERNVLEPARGLLLAQLVGFRSSVDPGYETAFRNLGLSHLLAVSGLHLGIWGGVCFWLLRRLLLLWPRMALKIRVNSWAAFLSAGPLLYYAAITGGALSVKRAALMYLGALGAVCLLRRTEPLNILAGAAWAILLIWPAALFRPSFQLSFAACLAIILAVRAGRARLSAFGPDHKEPARRPSWRRDLLLVSLAAGLGTAPIVVYHFGHFPGAGLAANLVFTPLLSFTVLPAGLAAVFLAPWLPEVSAWLFRMIDLALALILPGLAWFAEKAGPGPMLPRPGPLGLAVFYGLGFIWLSGSTRAAKLKRGLGLLTLALALGAGAWAVRKLGPDKLTLTVLDVGQGTAIHLRLPGNRHLLVDAGGGTSAFDPGCGLIKPYLLSQGVRRLDAAALSHPQNDHMGGLLYLAGSFRPREFWSVPWPSETSLAYRKLRRELEAAGAHEVNFKKLHQGLKLGSASVRALWPPADFNPEKVLTGKDLNDNSLVLMIEFAGRRLLLPGDIEAAGEARLVKRYGSGLRADVLVAPHHGSQTSLSPEFLKAVGPEWVIISAGRFNRFGFPHPKVLERLGWAGVKVWRTDLQGAFRLVWTADGRVSAPAPLGPGLVLSGL